MLVALVLLAPVLLPLLAAAIYLVAGWGPRTAWLSAGSAVVVLAAVITLAAQVSTSGPRTAAGGLLRADALSAFMLLVVAVVAVVACAATPAHLRGEISAGRARTRTATQHSVLVQVFLAAMALAVLAASLGLLWVAMEATTIVTAFLVGQRRTRAAVEAAWKYVVICSTGIAMALLGTFLLNYAAGRAGTGLDWAGVDRERRRPGPRRHPDRGRAADPRIRDQSRAGPAARLAARRAQPGPRAGVRADVRGAARGRVLRHPARQGHRRRDAGHRFRPHPAGRDRARLPAGGRDRS